MTDDAWALPEIGMPELKVHPVHLLDEDDWALLELWQAWRGGELGTGHLPFAGGVADQPACVMRSLGVMDVAAAKLTPAAMLTPKAAIDPRESQCAS